MFGKQLNGLYLIQGFKRFLDWKFMVIKEEYCKRFGKIMIGNWLRNYFLLKTKVSR